MVTQQSIPVEDRRAYLWLAIGFAVSFLATGEWVVAPAVWLPGIFLMRFMRTHRVLPGFLLVAAASVVSPVVGVTTLYARNGDAFAYATIVGFLVLALWAVIAGRPRATTQRELAT